MFDRFERTSQQKIEDFTLDFERRYNRIMQNRHEASTKLLDAPKIPHKDRQLVLTAVDYTKKEQLFEQMKSALRKFHGEQSFSMSESIATTAVKLEASLLTESGEVMYSRNRYQQSRSIKTFLQIR